MNAPILTDCPVSIECSVMESTRPGTHELFIGKVEAVHVDEEYAGATRFGKVIAPGLMVAGLISTIMTKATFGNVYSGQTLKFIKPVFVGDIITARAEVIDKLEAKHRVVVRTECFNQNGELVIKGEGQEYII